MRNRALLAMCVAALLGTPALAASETQEKACCKGKPACTSKAAKASSKRRCSLTGTVVERCCCVPRDGKLYCTLAEKVVDSCCCDPERNGSEASGQTPEAEVGTPLR